MRAAGERLLGDGGSPVVLVGSDIPMLGAEHVGAAIEALGKVDVVLGPASDGGYYLIGFWSLPVAMFDDHALSWGSDRVLETSERIARQQGLRSARITMLHDLDRPSDLATLRKQFASQRATVQRAQRTATVLAALDAASTAVEQG